MKTSLSSITNLNISPRGRKLPVSIYEFVAAVLSEYALSSLKVDSNDSAFHSISSYFVGGEILAKDLIQKLLIIPEIASIFDCFPSMGNGKEYDYAVWSQFLSDTTWEYDGKSNVFVFKEHTYAMENKVLILEKEPDGLFAKRLHCEATEQYYGRIGPGAREDKTAIQAPPIFSPRPQEVTMQDEDVEKAVSDSDFFTLDESLQGADPQQREAITSGIDKNLIILAGAGSGKTRTLVARLAYLRSVKKIPLNRILLLTFTVAAAAEMRSRGKSLVDVIYSNIAPTKKATVNARTIDSFVIQIVNTYYPQMGFSQKPVIYYSDNVETKQQKIQMLSEIIRENKLEGIFRFYLAGAGTQPEKLGRLLNDLIDYARGLPINCAGFDFLLQQYQEHQRASGKIMGFTEASLFVRDAIMQEDSPVKKGIIGKYSCILIDEFQDVNVLQNSIFEPFYDVGSINFTFVGDDDQSIYYWRGSDNTIIKNLVGKPNCRTTYLLTNYRNNPNIVEAGNAILSTIQNRAKKGKPIHANRATGEKIRITTYNSKFTNLINEINILLASGKSADEICILSRDRRTANSIRDELTAADIPVSKEDSIIVLSDMYREMKAILSILNAYDITASAKALISVTQSVNVTERHIQKIVKGRCTEVECEDSLKKVKALSDEVRLNQITSLADAVDRFSIKAGELYEGRVNDHHSDEVFEQFLNYFMLSMKRRYARSIAENATVIKRGGIHLSKADQKSIAQLKCLARHLHCALDEEKFPRKASAILSVAEDEIRRLLQLNQEAVILPTGVSDEDANILDLLPAGDNVELEMENRDTVSRFLSCVEKRFQSCQQRQKIAISPLLSAKILSYYPEVIDYINPASHSFFDQRMFKRYCETGEVPSAREISLSLGRSEASTSRSLKSFLEEVRKCMERPL